MKQINLHYYYYYYYYYYHYYYYYCLGLPETAFHKRLAVFPLKIDKNIAKVESNVLLVRSTQQTKWYISEAVTTQTCNIQSLQIYKVCNSRVTCSWKYLFLNLPVFSDFLKIEKLDQFIFIFFTESFFTHSVAWSVSCSGWKLSWIIKISFAVNSVGSKTLSAMPWISQSFEIKSMVIHSSW